MTLNPERKPFEQWFAKVERRVLPDWMDSDETPWRKDKKVAWSAWLAAVKSMKRRKK